MNWIRKIATIVVCVVCLALVIYLIFFFGNTKNKEEYVETNNLKNYTITFDTEELAYKSDVSFMEGVSAFDDDKNDLTSFVTVSCKPTNNLQNKTLVYSINKAGYNILTFERTLKVPNSYTGPSIKTVGTVSVPIDQIGNLSNYVQNAQAVETDDGFGKTCGITAEIKSSQISIGDYVADVTAQNIFGDTATTKVTVSVIEAENSAVKLSTKSITLNRGDTFNPFDYLVSANDKNGEDIKSLVQIKSDVDTSKSGSYIVEYRLDQLENYDEVSYLYVSVN